MKFHPGFLAGKGAVSIYKHIIDLGLDTYLRTCLDFGISETYSNGSQSLNDLSGHSADFWMGVDSGPTLDPTFHGTAGDGTSNEYMTVGIPGVMTAKNFQFWNNTIHAAGIRFTIMAVIKHDPALLGATDVILTTNAASNTAVGLYASTDGNAISLHVANGTGLAFNGSSSTLAVSGFNIMFISLDESGGASASHWRINSNTETFNGHYSSPSGSPATTAPQIGKGSQVPFIISAFSLWDTALSTTDTGNIYDAIKVRWGL